MDLIAPSFEDDAWRRTINALASMPIVDLAREYA